MLNAMRFALAGLVCLLTLLCGVWLTIERGNMLLLLASCAAGLFIASLIAPID